MKRIAGILALAASGMFAMTGCTDREEREPEPIVIDVYDSGSDYQGMQGGWYGQLLKEKFNIELNFLDKSSEDSLTGADLYICSAEQVKPLEMLEKGLLLNMEEYLDELPVGETELTGYRSSYEYWNGQLQADGIYVLPTQVSRLSEYTPSEEHTPGYGIYLNWEAYEKAGMPDIRDKEELLDVLQRMQDQSRKEGEDSQGLVLYRDGETDILDHVSTLMGVYGGQREGFLIRRQGRYEELLEEDSLYTEMLAWLRQAWQRGLITEDTIAADRDRMMDCYQNKTAMMSVWPKLGIAGYELAPVEDMKVVSYGCVPEGSLDVYVGIGADASDPFRILEFVDWLYSAEGIMISGTGTGLKAAGPEGLTWEVESGNPVLTDFGRQAFAWQLEKDVLTTAELQMPEEWGRGGWYQGSSRLSLQPVTEVEVTPSGFSYNYKLWDTTMEQYTDAPASWQERMEAFEDMEYLIRNDMLSILPAYREKAQDDPEDIAAQRKACREVITDYTLRIICAESEEEYKKLFTQMRDEAFRAGYAAVVKYDRTAK